MWGTEILPLENLLSQCIFHENSNFNIIQFINRVIINTELLIHFSYSFNTYIHKDTYIILS